MHGLDPWALIAFLFLFVPALAQLCREWGGRPVFSLGHLWAARWAICLLIGGGIFFGHQWFETVGFTDGWPDAISCRFTEPDSAATSKAIFYYKGTGQARGPYGSVVIYLLTGGGNAVVKGEEKEGKIYFPHEIWFKPDSGKLWKPIAKPADVSDAEWHDKIGLLGARYAQWFLRGLDCGGNSIEAIAKAGNAFSFARKFK